MVNLAKMEAITIGPPARWARNDTTLPGHINTNVIPLGKCVPTIISDEDSDLIVVRIPQTRDAGEERCNTNCRDDIVRFSGIELWKRDLKQEFIIKSRRGEEVAD